MADSSVPAQLPPAAERQSNFEQAVACALHLWPALTLSVQNNWGGPDSSDKRDWFAGAVVELFPEFTDASAKPDLKKVVEEPDLEDVETVLLQVMVDEFDVNVDDDSGFEVAEQIIRARTQSAIGETEELDSLRQRLAKRKGPVDTMFKKVEDADQDTDWETDDSGEDEEGADGVDVNMGGLNIKEPKEKPAPEIDEDGFTKVTRKR